MELVDCFFDFDKWLLRSQICKRSNFFEVSYYEKIKSIALEDIKNVLLKEPLANNFYYNDGILWFSKPNDLVVNGDSLYVDRNKIKIYLRNIKIDKILL